MIKTYERWFEKYWVFVLALFTVIHTPLVTDVVLTKNYAIVRGLLFCFFAILFLFYSIPKKKYLESALILLLVLSHLFFSRVFGLFS